MVRHAMHVTGSACREIVKRIDMWGIDMLFVVGGNGGNAGAAAIQAQCEKDSVVCNVVGVPKSIDNDILVVGTPQTATFCHSHLAASPAHQAAHEPT